MGPCKSQAGFAVQCAALCYRDYRPPRLYILGVEHGIQCNDELCGVGFSYYKAVSNDLTLTWIQDDQQLCLPCTHSDECSLIPPNHAPWPILHGPDTRNDREHRLFGVAGVCHCLFLVSVSDACNWYVLGFL